jgi:hypothetical protein
MSKGLEISKVCSKQRLLNHFITILTFNWKFIEGTEEKTQFICTKSSKVSFEVMVNTIYHLISDVE